MEPRRDEEDSVQQPARHVAPGGVRRLVIGFLLGLLAGALVALLLPRDADRPARG